jgi:hypothetical protein
MWKYSLYKHGHIYNKSEKYSITLYLKISMHISTNIVTVE